jgi:hypothetical protein
MPNSRLREAARLVARGRSFQGTHQVIETCMRSVLLFDYRPIATLRQFRSSLIVYVHLVDGRALNPHNARTMTLRTCIHPLLL